MKEKELRLALVCYGGVSLAIYMHGVTKEILKLVRASRAWHDHARRADRFSCGYRDLVDCRNREIDTEDIYLDLLKEIGAHTDLRVIVDTITGSSAGGINGVMLARALAHDLSLDAHREMWLEKADITQLMDESQMAGPWSKVFMKPLFWNVGRRWLDRYAPDEETREKLDLFTRSRWFRPPFSGDRLDNMLLDACAAMQDGGAGDASLLPQGQRLDLIVSTTDFFGHAQTIDLHDPPRITEREHRHHLKFSYVSYPGGLVDTDFADAFAPGLVFAARATSSFPGAFPPAQIQEIDRVLRERAEEWPGRETFIEENFRDIVASGLDPVSCSLIDGSVLNNKPFAEALESARGRPAYRQVDRRIVYIDPDPAEQKLVDQKAPPGFFHTIRGALSDIPRNEPVREELLEIGDYSERVRRYREVVEAARPHVVERVERLFGERQMSQVPTPQWLEAWRRDANNAAALESGYAYDGYVQLKVLSVLDWLAQVIGDLAGLPKGLTARMELVRAVEDWARGQGVFPVKWQLEGEGPVRGERSAPWVKFLMDYDANFRLRRLRFLIRRLNALYELRADEFSGVHSPEAMDDLKQGLYENLEMVRGRLLCSALAPRCGEKAAIACHDGTIDAEALGDVIDDLAPALNLPGADKAIDRAICVLSGAYLPEAIRKELLHAYVGFPFFDVITFPTSRWHELDDVDTIRIDRISPDDAQSLKPGEGKSLLRGRELGRFAAFFSRAARENDYLWGRLHGADRLVDIVVSAVPEAPDGTALDPWPVKLRLFRRILESERPHLPEMQALIEELEAEIAAPEARPA